jgi:hypothetical protein
VPAGDHDPMLPHEQADRMEASPPTASRAGTGSNPLWRALLLGGALLVILTGLGWAAYFLLVRPSGGVGSDTGLWGMALLGSLGFLPYALVGWVYGRSRRGDAPAAEASLLPTAGLWLITYVLQLGYQTYAHVASGAPIDWRPNPMVLLACLCAGYLGGLAADAMARRPIPERRRLLRGIAPLVALVAVLHSLRGPPSLYSSVSPSWLAGQYSLSFVMPGLLVGVALIGMDWERQGLWIYILGPIVLAWAWAWKDTNTPAHPEILWRLGLPLAAGALSANWLIHRLRDRQAAPVTSNETYPKKE